VHGNKTHPGDLIPGKRTLVNRGEKGREGNSRGQRCNSKDDFAPQGGESKKITEQQAEAKGLKLYPNFKTLVLCRSTDKDSHFAVKKNSWLAASGKKGASIAAMTKDSNRPR